MTLYGFIENDGILPINVAGGETYHILQETGDDILLETGDYILLELAP